MTARPTHILFPFVGGDVIGGSHRSALGLIGGLDPARHRAIIALHGDPGRLGQEIHTQGLEFRQLPDVGIMAPGYSRQPGDLPLWRYLIATLPRLRRVLRDWSIDIVHSNDGRMHVNWALPARLSGCRMIWHHRQDPIAFGVNKVAPLLADRIVSVSEFSRPRRPVRPIDSRFTVIRSPFDLPADRPDRGTAARDLRARIGAAPGAVLLGYVGALNPRKRPLHFIRAVAAVQAARPGLQLHGLICGQPEQPDDPILAEAQALITDLGLSGRLHLMGQVSPIEPVIAGLDALLVTALNEPFGRTLIEAMHLGTPVIATNHGGNPEAIDSGQTGFLVDPGDPAAFVTPLLGLVDDPGLRQRITMAAGRDLDRYSTAEHLRRMRRVYDDLIQRRSPA